MIAQEDVGEEELAGCMTVWVDKSAVWPVSWKVEPSPVPVLNNVEEIIN